MIDLNVEGTIRFDPQEEDLEGRIAELMEDGEHDPDDARKEAIRIILGELIGHTGFQIEYWDEIGA
jgi:hypothetical protein